MKISHSWIQKYVPLNIDFYEVSEALTNRGIEVETLEIQDLEGVVSAQVVSCVKHPNADKLSVCEVTDGQQVYPVVCGAPNVKKGFNCFFC